MPDTISRLAKELARLGRRVTALERARRVQPPAWRDLPLTGPAEIGDATRAPQIRTTPWETLELSGCLALTDQRLKDGTVLALLPEDHRPTTTRSVPVASDARKALFLDLAPSGELAVRLSTGSTTRITWISLTSASCRLDGPDEPT